MKIRRLIRDFGLLVRGGLLIAGISAPMPAVAQNPAYMSCDELWYERNNIYARNGYCFNTERAQSVFGAGCFPPYGQLSGWEKSRVNQLQMWERRKGC
jgi:hypothetical protein